MPEQFTVTAPGCDALRGYFWKAGSAFANLTVITGMNEYALRYDHFASALSSEGVNVWVLDAYGQGLNAASVEKQQIWPQDAFAHTVESVRQMAADAAGNGLPTFVMGHSMGSFMVQSLIERFPDTAAGVILCGSNGGQHALMTAAYGLAKLLVNKNNRLLPNPLLHSLSLGGYAKAIADRETDFDWLSHNRENVRNYIEDPWCGHPNTGGFWLEFLRGMTTIWNSAALKKISKNESVLIIGGKEDPVGRNGAGLVWLRDTYRKLGVRSVKMILYPGMRHEILNELGRETVYRDILDFIKSGGTSGT